MSVFLITGRPLWGFSAPTRQRFPTIKKMGPSLIETGEPSRGIFYNLHNSTTAARKPHMLQLMSENRFHGGCSHEGAHKTTEANCHADGNGQMSQKRLPACYLFTEKLFIDIRRPLERCMMCMEILNSCGQFYLGCPKRQLNLFLLHAAWKSFNLFLPEKPVKKFPNFFA